MNETSRDIKKATEKNPTGDVEKTNFVVCIEKCAIKKKRNGRQN